jgi:hypothetical protein
MALLGQYLAYGFAHEFIRLFFAYNPSHGRDETSQRAGSGSAHDGQVRIHACHRRVDYRGCQIGARRHRPTVAKDQRYDRGFRGIGEDDFREGDEITEPVYI